MISTPASPDRPHPTGVPQVLPASRQPGYTGGVHTRLADRAALLALARDHGGLTGEPGTPVVTDPPLGAAVAFPPHRRARCWMVGIVETTGRAGTRVAYVHSADRGRDHPEIRRARPHAFREIERGA